MHSRETTQKGSKGEQPFLHATHHLHLIYMYIKYHQNISKGIRVIERTSFPLLSAFKGDNSKGQQGEATILACYTPSSPDIFVYRLSSKYLKVYLALLSTQAFPYKVHSRETTQKGSKVEQPFLHVTYHPDLIYMYTKYHQNISKSTRVIEHTSFLL